MFTQINNILLGLYIVIALFAGNYIENYNNIKQNWIKGLPVFFFFILAIIAAFNQPDANPFKHLEKYWSFLLVPLAFIGQTNFYRKNNDTIFFGLLYGCIATLLLCFGNVIYEIVLNDEPLSYFYRWRHLGNQFTAIADTHPAYLGLFIMVSTLFIFQTKKIGTYPKIAILLIFTLGMLQLVSRLALFIYFIILFIEIWNGLGIQSKVFKVLSITLSAFAVLILLFGSEYYKNRIFSAETIKQDNRFERLIVSYEMFKENPILGVGFSKRDSIRVQKYHRMNFKTAADRNYNAHNQFMESLSTNGLVGGIVYLIVLGFLVVRSIENKEYLFSAIFLIFIIVNLTESMLVRIKGIEFFAIFSSLFLTSLIGPKPEE
jgi:hypothetical protein